MAFFLFISLDKCASDCYNELISVRETGKQRRETSVLCIHAEQDTTDNYDYITEK